MKNIMGGASENNKKQEKQQTNKAMDLEKGIKSRPRKSYQENLTKK